MAKSYFPINYKPTYSMTQTRNYIAGYLKKLFAAVEKNRNAFYIDPPAVTNYHYNWDAFSENQRLITFDHKYSYELNQMYTDISNYMRHVLITSVPSIDTAIYTYLPIAHRDGSPINESMVNNHLYIEMYAPHDVNHGELTKQVLENFFTSIKSINVQQMINKNNVLEYNKQSIVFITIQKLIKTFPHISLTEAINRFVISNGSTAVLGACQKINEKKLFPGLPTADDYNDAVVLYVRNESNNQATPIVKVSARPTKDIIKKQILSDIPEVIDGNIYLKTVLNDYDDNYTTIGITTYFSNIMRINLKKHHMSEVVHAPWSEDFMNYITKNKIEIM